MFAHWIADFVLQTQWQATNKSKNNWALFEHVTTYTIIISTASAPFVTYYAPHFFLITFITHFCTDYITSRMTSRLWVKGKYHNFFAIIGMDQFIHQVTLALTLIYLNG